MHLIKEAREVHVHDIAGGCIKQHVLAMPVAQAHNVPNLPTMHISTWQSKLFH